MSKLIQRLTIIGVGLIGGSLARALRQVDACGEIVGCGRDLSELQKAVDLGVIDRYEIDPAKAVIGADAVVLAVPLGAMRTVMEAIAPTLEANAILTDVGSAKASVVADAKAVFGDLPPGFVPGHPIAGTEQSGVEASFPTLYNKRKVILTPIDGASDAALCTVAQMWRYCGADIVEMSVEHHDLVLAATSHLPHFLAYTLVDSLARMDETSEIFQYAAGGFRDFTRIASSDPNMWHDICFSNRDEMLNQIARFRQHLDVIAGALESSDSEKILECFSRAKSARDHFSKLISE